LKNADYMPSTKNPKSKKHKHNLKKITIPCLDDAFKELASFDPESRISTPRERVLAKIIVDVFQLRAFDLAISLAVMESAIDAPPGEPVVVILYAGEDHTRSASEFWRAQGFHSEGLPNDGVVGKRDWEDDEPRVLRFPPYLQDLRRILAS